MASKLHATFTPPIPSNFLFTSKPIPSRTTRITCCFSPPGSKEEAIAQAKSSLCSALEKPLNKNPKLAGKIKKPKQPRFRVEIPVIDDSPSSLVDLALQVFGDMPVRAKGSKVRMLIIWPTEPLKQAGIQAFESITGNVVVESEDLSSVYDAGRGALSSADVGVFLAPEGSDLGVIKTVTDDLYPKPVVLFNPRWGFEEEGGFEAFGGFLGSFEVVYSFMGLEVRGIFSKRKGVVLKVLREKWSVLVEEDGGFKVVSSFKARPSIAEVEIVLYNLMAINSPITKSAKFLKDLVSNATGKK